MNASMLERGKTKTILLVEDEALIALAEAQTLKKYGFQVVIVYSGEEAIRAVASSPAIDLILMDIDLGRDKIDGTLVAERILQAHDLPLIFLSSHTEREIVEKTEGITSYGYIVKNSGETVLIASIKMAFRLFDARMKEKEEQNARLESEERFRFSMDATQDGLWDWHVDRHETYCSPAYWKMLGYAPDQQLLSANEWHRLIHPDDREGALLANRQAVENRCDSFVIEFRMRTASGDWRWIQSRGKAILRNQQGRALRMVGTHSDITERKQAEEKLRQSETRYRALFNDAPLMLMEEDFSESKLYLNQLQQAGVTDFNAYFDQHPEEVLRCLALMKVSGVNNATLSFFGARDLAHLRANLPATFPPEAFPSFKMALVALAENRLQFEDETVQRTLVGETRHVFMRVFVNQGEARPFSRIIVAMMDMTRHKQAEAALRESEEKFRTMTEQLREGEERFSSAFKYSIIGMALVSPEGRWLKVNQAVCDMLGYSAEALLATTFQEITHPDDLQSDWDNVQAMLAGDISTYQMQKRYIHQTGRIVWALLSVSLVRDENNTPLYFISQIVDISEHKQAQAALQKAFQEKQALLKELQHRAKNSFAMISSLISLTANTSQLSETKATLSQVGTWVRSTAELYDLLWASDATSLASLDEYCTRVTAALPLPGNIQMTHAYADISAPVKIAGPLGLILTELVTNAIKHAFPGGRSGTIRIELSQTADGARLTVKDDGVGMPSDFDPDNCNCLGLMLVQALAGQINGSFHTEQAAGTQCVLCFPLAEARNTPSGA